MMLFEIEDQKDFKFITQITFLVRHLKHEHTDYISQLLSLMMREIIDKTKAHWDHCTELFFARRFDVSISVSDTIVSINGPISKINNLNLQNQPFMTIYFCTKYGPGTFLKGRFGFRFHD